MRPRSYYEQSLVKGSYSQRRQARRGSSGFSHRPRNRLARPEEGEDVRRQQERSPQKLAEFRRDYLAQAKMLAVDERTQEAAKINKALGIKAPKGTAAAATLDTARAAYIRLLGSAGHNAEVAADVTRFREQIDKMQLRMLGPKRRSVRQHLPRQLTPAEASSLGSE